MKENQEQSSLRGEKTVVGKFIHLYTSSVYIYIVYTIFFTSILVFVYIDNYIVCACIVNNARSKRERDRVLTIRISTSTVMFNNTLNANVLLFSVSMGIIIPFLGDWCWFEWRICHNYLLHFNLAYL